jgi:WD40 repeat protein
VAVDESGRTTCWEVVTGRFLRAFLSGHQKVSSGRRGNGIWGPVKEGAVGYSAISADGRSVLISSCLFRTSLTWLNWTPPRDYDTLRLLDAETGKLRRAFGAGKMDGYEVAVSADGKRVLAGGDEAVLWDAGMGEAVRTFKNPLRKNPEDGRRWATCVALSPDGGWAAVWGYSGPATVWDVKQEKPLCTVAEDEEKILAAAFPPKGRQLLTLGEKSGLTLWDLATGKPAVRFALREGEEKPGAPLAFSPDGKLVLTGGDGWESDLLLWDAASGKKVRSLLGKGARLQEVVAAFSPSGKCVVTGGSGQTLKLWDVATGRLLRRFTEPPASKD